MDVWHVGKWIPVWEHSLVTLIQNFDAAKLQPESQEHISQVRVEGDVPGLLPKIANHNCHVFSGTQTLSALPKNRRHFLQARVGIVDVAEIAIIVTIPSV